MTTTADDEDLTEFELIEVESIKGVPQGANGFPHLIMKGMPDADGEGSAKAVTRGKVDEAPDIAIGNQIMALLGQAIGNEAQEVSAGQAGEINDVRMLTRAADIVSAWCRREQAVAAGQDPDASCGCCEWCQGIGCGCCPGCGNGMVMCAAATEAAEKAKLSAAERDNLPDSAFAIPETRDYPIHDETHARNALSRVAQNGTDSEKKRVRAAVRKKYPGIGDDDSDDSSSKGTDDVAEGETTVDTDAQGTGAALTKGDLDAAIAKAIEPLKAENASLREDLAKVKATPIPGGPVMSSLARPMGAQTQEAEDLAAKAALYRAKADACVSPGDREGYRQLARETDAQAAKLTTAVTSG